MSSLMHLVAMNSMSYNRLNIKSKYTTDYNSHKLVNNNVITILHNNADLICPEFLEIELLPNIDANEFKNICHKICLRIEIGGNVIFNVPLRFMMLLKEYEICDNKFYINIPFKMFCDDIKCISALHKETIFYLSNTENNFSSCNLILKNYFYDSVERNLFMTNSYETIIQSLSSTEINCQNLKNIFVHNMDMGLYKGFFIECVNVDEINEIILILRTEVYNLIKTNYNRFLVKMKCVKLNQNLLYFPLNYEKSYIDRNREDFEGLLDLINDGLKCEIIIKFDNMQSKICVYNLSVGILNYTAGMAYVSSFNYFTHDYIEFNENMCNEILEIIKKINLNDSNLIKINKPITNINKLMCNITLENIKIDEEYMCCFQCNNNFNANSLKEWLNKSKNTNKCPSCRSNWCNFNVYINNNCLIENNEKDD